MDRKTTKVLNSVVRELFEDEKTGIGVTVQGRPIEVDSSGPLGEKELNAMRDEEMFAPEKIGYAADEVAAHSREADAIRSQIALDKINSAVHKVADHYKEAADLRKQIRDARNSAISRGASPDAWTAGDEDEARDIVYQTAKSKFIPERNPHTGPDLALGDLDVPWYQQGWQWVQDHPGYTALAVGAPLALTGAYMLGKRRAAKK